MHVHELFMSHLLWNHCNTRWLRVMLGQYIGECTYQQLISVMVLKNLPFGIQNCDISQILLSQGEVGFVFPS